MDNKKCIIASAACFLGALLLGTALVCIILYITR
jgi:hypothetical protein